MTEDRKIPNSSSRTFLKRTAALAWDMLTYWRHIPESISNVWYRLLMDGFWTSVGALIALVFVILDPFLFWLAPLLVLVQIRKERRWREMGYDDDDFE